MLKPQTTPPEDAGAEPEVIPPVENQQPPVEEIKPVQNGVDLIFSMFQKKGASKKGKK